MRRRRPGLQDLLVLGALLMAAVLVPAVSASGVTPNPLLIDGNEEIIVEGPAVDLDLLDLGPDLAISDIFVYGVAPDTTVSIRVGRPGETYPGSFRYRPDGLYSNMTLSLGDGTASWRQLSPVKLNAAFCIRYASTNATSGIALSDVPPWNQNYLAYQAVPDISTAPLTSVSLSTDNNDQIRVRIRYNSIPAIGSCVENYGNSTSTDYVGLIVGFFTSIVGIVSTLIAVFKFVFVDHFVAVVVLYESVLIGYAASHSRSLVQFTKKFVKSNEYLFTLLLKFTAFVLDSLYKLIQAVKPI
ncbi:MAG: hypothetical protein WC138_13650 [Methanoculleus sp.]